MAQGSNDARPIIIKRIKKIAAGHHGGAWKVAYADFVTAMMAFFLMLWLLSTTTKEQKDGISEYFTYAAVSKSNIGVQGVLGGKSLESDQGIDAGKPKVTIELTPPGPPAAAAIEADADTPATGAPGSADGAGSSADGEGQEVLTQRDAEQKTSTLTDKAVDQAIADRERREFEAAEKQLKQAIKDIPELSQLSDQLIIDHTPEGMRIQLVDQADRPMFKAGTAQPFARTYALFREISKVINRLPNRISISGHTDSAQYRRIDGTDNWELSMERAMISRRVLEESGIASKRFFQVTGKASNEPLFPEDPYLPGNRRISITLMRESPALAPNALGGG